MRTVQSKLTAQIAAIAETSCGLEILTAASAGNVGTWYVLDRPDGTDTVLSVRWDFQDGYATFRFTGPALARLDAAALAALPGGWKPRRTPAGQMILARVEYADGERTRGLLAAVAALLVPYRRHDLTPADEDAADEAEARGAYATRDEILRGGDRR